MRSNPLPGLEWVQALADSGPWRPPPEWAQDYGWLQNLPQPLAQAPTGQEIAPPQGQRMRQTEPWEWQQAAPTEWSDIPDWLQALNDDSDYLRTLAPGGWVGGAMRRRGR